MLICIPIPQLSALHYSHHPRLFPDPPRLIDIWRRGGPPGKATKDSPHQPQEPTGPGSHDPELPHPAPVEEEVLLEPQGPQEPIREQEHQAAGRRRCLIR